jgi:hypothetical protein
MERSSGPRQTTSKLSESVRQHFNMYAMAAAVAVMLLAVAHPVEAKIVYTKVNINFIRYNLDLNNDGITDVAIGGFERAYPCALCRDGQTIVFNELPASGNGVLGNPPAALKQGAQIGPSQVFYGGNGTMSAWYSASRCGCTEHHVGNWFEVTNRYLGVAFKIAGKTHYGWARMSTGFRSVMLTGYAYETIPGQAIIAGATSGAAPESSEENFGHGASLTNPIPNTPQPASFCMLALGAQGVPLWRRKESALED